MVRYHPLCVPMERMRATAQVLAVTAPPAQLRPSIALVQQHAQHVQLAITATVLVTSRVPWGRTTFTQE